MHDLAPLADAKEVVEGIDVKAAGQVPPGPKVGRDDECVVGGIYSTSLRVYACDLCKASGRGKGCPKGSSSRIGRWD